MFATTESPLWPLTHRPRLAHNSFRRFKSSQTTSTTSIYLPSAGIPRLSQHTQARLCMLPGSDLGLQGVRVRVGTDRVHGMLTILKMSQTRNSSSFTFQLRTQDQTREKQDLAQPIRNIQNTPIVQSGTLQWAEPSKSINCCDPFMNLSALLSLHPLSPSVQSCPNRVPPNCF